MIKSSKAVRSIVLCVFFVTFGCASHMVSQTKTDDGKVPQDVPAEFKSDKFVVKDLTSDFKTPSTADPVVASASNKKELKAESKKEKKKKLKGGASTPSVADLTPPNRRPSVDPLWVGEKLVYEVTYFGVPAGTLTLEIQPFKSMNDRKVYHVTGLAESSSVFSLVYKLHDTLDTFFDYEGLFSYKFQVVLNESKQYRNSIEMYNHEKAQSFFWSRWDHVTKGHSETKEYFPMTRWAHDSLSALYYLRTLDWSGSATHIIPIVAEGKGFDAIAMVVRREEMKTPNGNKNCIVIKPETRFNGVMEKKGDSFMWVTDDEHHYLVRVEAKVKIGTVVATLKSIEPGKPQ